MTDDGRSLATTFDSAAGTYQEARPEYPDALFGELARLAGLRPGAALLEVGCATGKATIPLASRGYRLTCLEIGPHLAATARQNLAGFPGTEVIDAAFETWQPPHGARYDLVFAATAWHWLDPAVRYQRAWSLLRDGGHLAFWSATHVVPDSGDPFFRGIQDVYDEIGEGMPGGWDPIRPGEIPEDTGEILATGLFTDAAVRQFDWETTYTAQEYIRLLDTFSGHIAMAPWQRGRLYAEITRRLATRPGGKLRRHWGAALHVARRRDEAGPATHV